LVGRDGAVFDGEQEVDGGGRDGADLVADLDGEGAVEGAAVGGDRLHGAGGRVGAGDAEVEVGRAGGVGVAVDRVAVEAQAQGGEHWVVGEAVEVDLHAAPRDGLGGGRGARRGGVRRGEQQRQEQEHRAAGF
jgi:hypothetical protein